MIKDARTRVDRARTIMDPGYPGWVWTGQRDQLTLKIWNKKLSILARGNFKSNDFSGSYSGVRLSNGRSS